MFHKPTVFNLGAGASWHYGYPTGEKLVSAVASKAEILEKYFSAPVLRHPALMPAYVRENILRVRSLGGSDLTDWQNAWKAAAADCTNLRTKLRNVDPLVIDYFLGWNSELQDLARILIAWVLRECETEFHKKGYNPNRDFAGNDNWIRFVLHRLMVGCANDVELLENQIRFFTFNYDVSLEHHLFEGLRANSCFTPDGIRAFLGGNRFVHVYGKIREDPFGTFTPLHPLHGPTGVIDDRYACTYIDDHAGDSKRDSRHRPAR